MGVQPKDNILQEKNAAPESAPPETPGNGRAESPPVATDTTARPRQPQDHFTLKSVLKGLLFGLFLAAATLVAAPKLRDWAFAWLPDSPHMQAIHLAGAANVRKTVRDMERRGAALRGRFERLLPREPYLIVNSSENKIYVRAGNKLIHEGMCSTGSNVLLKATDNRQWMFATPRGMFRVIGKVRAPVWRMPDWAFIEEGRPVPPPDSPERFETGVLGDYALAFGNGYLIHGTLYKRMLGMPVTHGCVRLDDHELEVVYKSLQVGSRIFIY